MTATSVAPLSVFVQSVCPVCRKAATWQIGPDARSCDFHLPAMIRRVYQALNPPSCRCNSANSQSCEICDGTVDQYIEPLPGDACIGYAPDGGLCDRRAEQGSDFCVDHQSLAQDRLVVIR